MKSVCLLAIPLVCVVHSLLAQEPADDPVGTHLFPPELLIQHRTEIGLTDEQLDNIRARLAEAGPKMQRHQRRVKEERQKLAQLLAAERVDEEAALKQLDKVIAAEEEVRRTQFQAMLRIRNELSGKQQRIAANLIQGAGRRAPRTELPKSLPDTRQLSPEAIRAEAESLKKEGVAWRKIEWKTCLIDGLKASREQGKPIMLWIFIDRPIDDERC